MASVINRPKDLALANKLAAESKIFIDTCSLMEQAYPTFEPVLFQALERANERLIIPEKVWNELNKLMKASTERPDLSKRAQRALEGLSRYHRKNLVVVRSDSSDNFADNVFSTQFTKFRMNYNLTLITQDGPLSRDILRLNNIESQKSQYKIRVFCINQYGFLEERFLDEKAVMSSCPSAKTNPINKKKMFTLKTQMPDYEDRISELSELPKEGDVVYAFKRKGNVRLTRLLGEGGEGAVYETDIPGTVCKIYRTTSRYRDEKLVRMLESGFLYPGVCWPTDAVLNKAQNIAGMLMPAAKGTELRKSVFLKPLLERHFPNWRRQELVQLAVTILEKIDFLHHHNVLIGDINPANILVASPKEVYFVDVDSYQIEQYPCPVGTVFFTAPELLDKNYTKLLRTRENELFGVATLLFMIMLPGKSPYAQQGGADPKTNIREMDFSYPCGSRSNKKAPAGPWRYCWSHLPRALKNAFYETFHHQGCHSAPADRITTGEWLIKFREYLALLESGKFTMRDPESGKLFPTRFKIISGNIEKCQICGREFSDDDLENGYCQECLHKGSATPCRRCGAPVFYSNHRKLILRKPAFPLCKSCYEWNNQVFNTVACINCGQTFTITNGEKDYFEKKGYELPKRCPSCRKQSKNLGAGSYVHTSAPKPQNDSIFSQLFEFLFK